jgi:hypothetical protein
MNQRGALDAWDVLSFLVGAIGGIVLVALATGSGRYAAAGVTMGWGGVDLRRRFFPKPPPELRAPERTETTGRGVLGAICFGIGIMVAPLSGLVFLVTFVREIVALDGKWLWIVVSSGAVFATTAAMLRFAFRVERS